MDKLFEYISSDLYRYCGNTKTISFVKCFLISPGFKYSFFLRICQFLKNKNRILYYIFRLTLRHYGFKFGFDIPVDTKIGYGLYIGHFGGVVVSSKAIIGDNVNISQNVTIGFNSRGKRKGYPTIKDECFIGPGAVVIGAITVNRNVCIGANAVVANDCLENEVIIGIPGRTISNSGTEGYILNKWRK